MNKNIRKMVAVALTISALSAVAPASTINLMTTKAYAASSDYKLTDIELEASSGGDITLYEKSSYSSKLDDDEDLKTTYYAKVSSSKSKVKINVFGNDEGQILIFKDNNSKAYKEDDDIPISSGKTTLYINVCDDDDYEDEAKGSYQKRYKIVIERGTSSSDEDEDETGDVYLKSISLSDGDIDFSKKTSTYDINVLESVSDITITAKPDCDSDEYDDYEVRIDGTEVDESDKFKTKVSLSKGKNTVKISVEDDYEEVRTYTLNINRGGTTTNTNTNTTTSIKANQWVTINGRMQYNDSLGNPLKNQWFYDRSVAKYYYLGADGYKATGWTLSYGKWYYLDGNGAMQTGWQYIGGTWYMLDASGAMITGWYKDFDSRWYYLQSSGAMASNTKIGQYNLGANGAWIR